MSTGFSVSNGQIIGPNGQPFIAGGVDIWGHEVIADPVGSANLIESLFPNANMVRIAADDGYSADSVAALTPFINAMTAKGVVVEIGDYNPALTNSVSTGSAMTQEVAWFTSLAAAFKNNPYVWFSTDNEPSDNGNTGATSAEQLAVYNAIRGTGNTSMIGLENSQWTINGQQEFSASISQADIAGMTNVHWDDHYYNWLSNYSTSVSANLSALDAEVTGSQAYTDAQGKIPVIIGEYGPATTGNGSDPGATATITAVLESGYGSTAWGINSGGTGDQLVNGNSLTSYGQQVAAAETTPPSGGSTGAGGTTATGAITPGKGSFTDAAGNVYTIDTSGNADENGKPIPGGGGTAQMELSNGNVYGQDASTGSWYIWNQVSWQSASAPPAGGTTGGSTPPPPPPVITPSPSGTEITTTSAAPIIDKAGNSWSLVQSASKGLQIAINGVVDAPTANVVILETLNGAMVQENTAGNWYSETTPNDSWVELAGNPNPTTGGTTPPPPPPPPAVPAFPTATDAYVTIGKGTFTVGSNTYDVDGGGNAIENGKAIPGGSGTSAMAGFNGTVLGQDAGTGTWYTWNQNSWQPQTASVIDVASAGTLTRALSSTGTATENGDTFVLAKGSAITATLGAGNDNMAFIGSSTVALTGGSGKAQTLLLGGTNTVTAGTGSLDVTAAGKDSYVFHSGDGLLTIEDFSTAKGDVLTVDKALQGSMASESDGHGGTALIFAANSAIDLKGVTAVPTINWQ